MKTRHRRLAGLGLAISVTTGATLAVAPHRASAEVSTGWELTVYWTPLERYFTTGQAVDVPNCDPSAPSADLGLHDSGFLAAVVVQGMGRTLAPVDAQGDSYISWNGTCGSAYSAPLDAIGGPLQPFVTMAGDPSVIPSGTAVRVLDCGTDGGAPIDSSVCSEFQSAAWRVTDTGVTGQHLDMYIGEQDRDDMTMSRYYHDLTGATIDR